MATSAQNSRRPVTVSSMSSLDSSASASDASRDKKSRVNAVDHGPTIHGGDSNVVSSSTLNSIGISPPHDIDVDTSMFDIETNAVATSSSTAPSGMLLSAPVRLASTVSASAPAPVAASAAVPNSNTVAEFLFQLSKMLTDDNKEIIEWSNGQINVHDPYKLQSDVLHKYFRHSKFASFQRQLNYFGFRKLAGKGKMAPCSYVNEATTDDIRSLLLIKRKTGPSNPKEKSSRKRSRSDSSSTNKTASTAGVNPVLAGILQRNSGVAMESKGAKATPSSGASAKLAVGKGVRHQLNGYHKQSGAKASSSNSQQALAQTAVGKGVRHGWALPAQETTDSATAALASSSMFFPDQPPQLGPPDLQESLFELTNNYRNSLEQDTESSTNLAGMPDNEAKDQDAGISDPSFQMYNFLSRDSSLVDLAMLIPATNEGPSEQPIEQSSVEPTSVNEMAATLMPFVDFPLETSSQNEESE